MGQVRCHFTVSVDGFVAGPEHDMGWMAGTTFREGLVAEYTDSLGAVLGGRDGWDAGGGREEWRAYGGAWQGPTFVLTHHPQDAAPVDGVTFLSCDVAEAARIALEAAAGKDLEVHSPSIGRQLLERGLVDVVDLHVAPVLLGDGIRLFDNPGGTPVRLARLDAEDPAGAVDLRFRPLGP